jgi:hypothetical protein
MFSFKTSAQEGGSVGCSLHGVSLVGGHGPGNGVGGVVVRSGEAGRSGQHQLWLRL